MSTVLVSTLVNCIAALLTEVYEGPPDPRSTWFIDNEPDAGVFGALRHVTAQEASTSVDGSGDSGSTIASHAEHLHWSLANINATMRGEAWNPDWKESWLTSGADEAEWERLQQALKEEFETLRRAIKRQEELPGEYLMGVLAITPHAAFHLGLIRQMVERVKGMSSVS
jgi:hypothetical protein